MTRTGLFPEVPKKTPGASHRPLIEFVTPLAMNEARLPDEGTAADSKLKAAIAASMSAYPRSRIKSLLARALAKEVTGGRMWSDSYDAHQKAGTP
jgi:hypothetical protein